MAMRASLNMTGTGSVAYCIIHADFGLICRAFVIDTASNTIEKNK